MVDLGQKGYAMRTFFLPKNLDIC